MSKSQEALTVLRAVMDSESRSPLSETRALRDGVEALRGQLPRKLLAEQEASLDRIEAQVRLGRLRALSEEVCGLFAEYGIRLRIDRVVKPRKSRTRVSTAPDAEAARNSRVDTGHPPRRDHEQSLSPEDAADRPGQGGGGD